MEVEHLAGELGTQPWHIGINQSILRIKQSRMQNKFGKELKENWKVFSFKSGSSGLSATPLGDLEEPDS